MLHLRPWSESSLLVDVFTREYGRFRLLAKGARKQKTGSRAYLQCFQPLTISWSGRNSLQTLTGVEAASLSPAKLDRSALASLYYSNELVFKFLHANDAHEDLFDAYHECVQRLHLEQVPADVLRHFECALLSEVGYGLILDRDAYTGEVIEADKQYFYYPEKGPVQIDQMQVEQGLQVSGLCLLELKNKKFSSDKTRQQSKRLLRNLLERQLAEGRFRTRRVFTELLRYGKKSN